MNLTKNELHLIRQWFDSVQDLSRDDYLETKDYQLAKKIYEELDMRVPNDIEGQSYPHIYAWLSELHRIANEEYDMDLKEDFAMLHPGNWGGDTPDEALLLNFSYA